LKTASGKPIALGPELARGGEGAIYPLAGNPAVLAKIYDPAPDAGRVAKLRAMIAAPPAARLRNLGWPTDLILAGNQVTGFTMPRLPGRELHTLWSGQSRRTQFPEASYGFIVAVAANLARAFAAGHEAGLVIGDVNERCALVAEDATVSLIDCDSAQIESGGRAYPCDVGTPNFQPPELQAVPSFRGLRRTRNHDAFGLAVVIFHLLFFARHPFAGRPASGESPEIHDAIAAFQFAWAEDRGLLRPPRTLPLWAAGPDAEALFRRAFGPEGAAAGRPTAASWVRTLDKLRSSLRQCRSNAAHQYYPPKSGDACPLCELEADIGGNLFAITGRQDPARQNPVREAERLWAAIAAIRPPPPLPRMPQPRNFSFRGRPYRLQPSFAPFRLLQTLGVLATPYQRERQSRQRQLDAAQAAYAALARQWAARDPAAAFRSKSAALAKARQKLAEIFAQRDAEVRAAAGRAALIRYLSGFPLAKARITGVGKKRLTTLAAHGIVTAADVSPEALEPIPGFGPALKTALISWRQSLERRSQAPATAMPTPAQTQRIDARFAPAIATGLAALRDGAQALQSIVADERAETERAYAELTAAAAAVAQAEADLESESDE
jgi:DNA-binding helix-hairpin-helix protein with protein kinase domain